MYWTDERDGERVLLICGFGTSDAGMMEQTYGKLLEEARRTYPHMSVRVALTSPKVIDRLYAKSGLRFPDVRSALEDAAAAGTGEIRILTVQIAGGTEYEKLEAAAEEYGRQIRIRLDRPLLAGPKMEQAAEILLKEASSLEEDAVVYAGHGTHGRDPRGPATYGKLQEVIRSRNNRNVFIGDLQTGPQRLARALSEGHFRRISLNSLMMVSGHHWSEDVAGDGASSWKNVLLEAGYEVTCREAGLLEREAFRELLIREDRQDGGAVRVLS